MSIKSLYRQTRGTIDSVFIRFFCRPALCMWYQTIRPWMNVVVDNFISLTCPPGSPSFRRSVPGFREVGGAVQHGARHRLHLCQSVGSHHAHAGKQRQHIHQGKEKGRSSRWGNEMHTRVYFIVKDNRNFLCWIFRFWIRISAIKMTVYTQWERPPSSEIKTWQAPEEWIHRGDAHTQKSSQLVLPVVSGTGSSFLCVTDFYIGCFSRMECDQWCHCHFNKITLHVSSSVGTWTEVTLKSSLALSGSPRCLMATYRA